MIGSLDPNNINASDLDLFKKNVGSNLPFVKDSLAGIFHGKRVLILASAPDVTLPASNTYDVAVTVNGAALIAHDNHIHNSLALINGYTAQNTGLVAKKSLKVIGGCKADFLLYIDVGIEVEEGVSNIKNSHFEYKKLLRLNALERAYIIGEAISYDITLGARDKRVSNGIFLATLMIWVGAKNLILSGFSLSGGHVYIKEPTPRHHVYGDSKWFEYVKNSGAAVITNSLPLTFETGLTYMSENTQKAKFINACNNLISPVILHAANNTIKECMPVHVKERTPYSCLEAIGRTLSGIMPNIQLLDNNNILEKILLNISSKESTGRLNFDTGTQPLVDAAFLALALIRAPSTVWEGLSNTTKQQIISVLKSSRIIKPHFNNWLLFSAMIEAFFFMAGEDYDKMRIDYALRQHEQWYLGDGHYGDGANFRADYYNSYVILPFLLQITQTLKGQFKDWDILGVKILERAKRYAEIQERMISPDGTFPPVGRSIAYRGGAFHLLAQLALMKQLPATLKPAQVRCALWAVIEKTLIDRSNYDADGWLQIGLNGHQPSLGENYISTGSLYLTSVIFLPLGLPEDDEFWSAPDEPWTQKKIWWFGYDTSADKAI